MSDKKITDAKFTVVSGPRPGPRPAPTWLRAVGYLTIIAFSLLFAVEKQKQGLGMPNMIDQGASYDTLNHRSFQDAPGPISAPGAAVQK